MFSAKLRTQASAPKTKSSEKDLIMKYEDYESEIRDITHKTRCYYNEWAETPKRGFYSRIVHRLNAPIFVKRTRGDILLKITFYYILLRILTRVIKVDSCL